MLTLHASGTTVPPPLSGSPRAARKGVPSPRRPRRVARPARPVTGRQVYVRRVPKSSRAATTRSGRSPGSPSVSRSRGPRSGVADPRAARPTCRRSSASGRSGHPTVVRIFLVRQYVTTLARSGRLRTTEPRPAAEPSAGARPRTAWGLLHGGHLVDGPRMRVDPLLDRPRPPGPGRPSGSPVPGSSARPASCASSPAGRSARSTSRGSPWWPACGSGSRRPRSSRGRRAG